MKGLVYPTAFGARDDVCNNRWEPPSELGGLYNILVKDNCRGVLQDLRFRDSTGIRGKIRLANPSLTVIIFE